MGGEEFAEELYRENLYYVYKEKSEELQKRIDEAISCIEPKGWTKCNKTYRERKMLEILKGKKEV